MYLLLSFLQLSKLKRRSLSSSLALPGLFFHSDSVPASTVVHAPVEEQQWIAVCALDKLSGALPWQSLRSCPPGGIKPLETLAEGTSVPFNRESPTTSPQCFFLRYSLQYGFFLWVLVLGVTVVYSCKSIIFGFGSEAARLVSKWTSAFVGHKYKSLSESICTFANICMS